MSFVINATGGGSEGPSGAVPVGAVLFDEVFTGPFTGLPQATEDMGWIPQVLPGAGMAFVVPYTAQVTYVIRAELKIPAGAGEPFTNPALFLADMDSEFPTPLGGTGYSGAGEDVWVPHVCPGTAILLTGQTIGLMYDGRYSDPALTTSFRNARVRIVDVVGN